MKHGLIEAKNDIRFFDGDAATNYVGLRSPANLPVSILFKLPGAFPGTTQALLVDPAGNLTYGNLGAGGTVTSVAVAVPSFLNVSGSPITTDGTITIGLVNQAAGTVFAAPPGGGAPVFRALAFADISAFVGTGSNTIAAGNDSRFHSQNTDIGTTSATFAIDSDAAGPLLKNNAGLLEVRNATDTGYADIIVGNVTIRGNTTIVESETMAIGDSTIILNQEYAGSTPTENGGIEIERGTLANAGMTWDESSDRWMAGLVGSQKPLSRYYEANFTNSSLVAGILTVTHNLDRQYVPVVVVDSTNKALIPDDITFTGVNGLAIDLTSYGAIAGTWKVSVG